jgi:quercetin dioxygenase-like cupin family protein
MLRRFKMQAASKSLISADGVDIQFLVDAVDSDGQATAFVTTVAPGGNTLPPHSHDWDETMYVTSGTLTFVIDGETREVSAGEAVFIAGGQVHKYDNYGTESSSMLIVSTPGLNHESYFSQVADVLSASSGPERDQAVRAIMDEYGVVPA